MAVEQDTELVTVQEAALLLKVSPVTIKRYLKQGRLRGYHLGPRALRIKREDLSRSLTPMTGTNAAPPEHKLVFARPSPEELARRRKVVEEILALRERASIAPLTTAELVRMARDKDTWYGSDE